MQDLDARLRLGMVEDEQSLEASIDERLLAKVYLVTMMTRYGPLDVLFEAPGMPPYRDLKRRAERLKRFGLDMRVASLEDIVASKRAAGREKDAVHLIILLEFMDVEGTHAENPRRTQRPPAPGRGSP